MDDIVFIGNWTKDRILGSGSFGIVSLWKHNQTDEKLAIKVCKWGDELTSKHRERWSKEVDMMKHFENDNIVATKALPSEFVRGLSMCNPSDLPMLCMEYCSGGDLRRILNRPESCFGLREFEVRQILHDVSTAVRYLHDNKITHRDLKPENIVLQLLDSPNSSGRSVVYKLIDLGYAKEIDSNSVCASFVGTLQYLAPELFYSKTYSNSVDFWSLGLLTFEVMCGERPFLTNLPPVQWMEHVKKKSSEHIRVYENYHKDIEYSSEICPENRVSAPFKQSMEKWLRVALEWDPRRRGYSMQNKLVKFALLCDEQYPKQNIETAKTNGLVIFTLLQNILNKKIINIFSTYTYSQISYEIDDSVLISTLKGWIERDTKVMCVDQMLISLNIQNKVLDSDLAAKFWTEDSKPMLFLYHREKFLDSNIQPNVPILIKNCLEQPKMVFSYNSSKELYKNCFYLVNYEKDLYECMITACIIRIENLKLSAKQLLVMHNEIDKCVGKLLFSQDILTNILITNRTKVVTMQITNPHIVNKLHCLNAAGDELLDNITKLQDAWAKLTIRMQSALRRSSEINSVDIHSKLNSKNEFKICYAEAHNAYINFRKKREFRTADVPCLDVVKCVCKCLKLRDAILQDLRMQQFVQKILDIDLEIVKMHNIIATSSINTAKLSAQLKETVSDIHTSMWELVHDDDTRTSCKGEESHIPMTVSSYNESNMEVEYNLKMNDFFNHDLEKEAACNNELISLVEDSITLRQSYSALKQKIDEQKSLFQSDVMEFLEIN